MCQETLYCVFPPRSWLNINESVKSAVQQASLSLLLSTSSTQKNARQKKLTKQNIFVICTTEQLLFEWMNNVPCCNEISSFPQNIHADDRWELPTCCLGCSSCFDSPYASFLWPAEGDSCGHIKRVNTLITHNIMSTDRWSKWYWWSLHHCTC